MVYHDYPIRAIVHRTLLEGNLFEYAKKVMDRPFDYSTAFLFEAHVLSDGTNEYLMLKFHHLIVDGPSVDVIQERLSRYYTGLVTDSSVQLRHDTAFLDHVESEHCRLSNGDYAAQARYWEDKAARFDPLLLPGQRRARTAMDAGREVVIDLPETMLRRIDAVAAEHQVTAYALLLGSAVALFSKYAGTSSITLPSPFTYRPGWRLEESVGCFIHMLPMLFDLDSKATIPEFLQRVHAEFVRTYQRIGYPANRILRHYHRINPQASASDLFGIAFLYDEVTSESEVFCPQPAPFVHFPGELMLVVQRSPSACQVKVQYKPDTFDAPFASRLAERYESMLSQMLAAAKDDDVSTLQLLTEKEREQIVEEYQATVEEAPACGDILTVFEETAAIYPNNTAIYCNDQQWTYHQVLTMAGR